MPFLPLNCPEPFAATLGIMLNPGNDPRHQRKARAFAAQYLAVPYEHFRKAGHELSHDRLGNLFVDAGERLDDLDKRWKAGLAMGELFKTLFALVCSKPDLCSWSNAIQIYERVAARNKVSGCRSSFYEAKRRFEPVAHLWAAWSIREGQFRLNPAIGYGGLEDFQAFLTETEILRDFGQHWQASDVNRKPLLSADVWRVPENWCPPQRRPDWPKTGMIPYLSLPADLLIGLKPAGRPRQCA